MGQIVLARKGKEKFKIPTFYLTQVIGLAMGLTQREVGVDVHRIKAKKLLDGVDIS